MTPRCFAASAHHGSRARSAQPRPAPPTWRSTARCRRSSTRISRSAKLIVIWGANPSASGIHLLPYIREAQRRGARLVVIDPRTTPLAKQADLHLAVRPGTDLPVALAIHRYLFEEGHADRAFLAAHTRGADRLREKALPWTFERAAREADVPPSSSPARRAARRRQPAIIRCGWGQERNRNGGNAHRSPFWRCLQWPGSSACAAAATR